MLALGLSSGSIKIMSLKGYEQEIYRAHESEVKRLAFIPNKGFLISVDDCLNLKLWNLQDLEECDTKIKIPEPFGT
jgi:hypothetical protein